MSTTYSLDLSDFRNLLHTNYFKSLSFKFLSHNAFDEIPHVMRFAFVGVAVCSHRGVLLLFSNGLATSDRSFASDCFYY